MSLLQIACIVKSYRELLNQFDLDDGLEEPEFGYQMLGIMRSLVGVLEDELSIH